MVLYPKSVQPQNVKYLCQLFDGKKYNKYCSKPKDEKQDGPRTIFNGTIFLTYFALKQIHCDKLYVTGKNSSISPILTARFGQY